MSSASVWSASPAAPTIGGNPAHHGCGAARQSPRSGRPSRSITPSTGRRRRARATSRCRSTTTTPQATFDLYIARHRPDHRVGSLLANRVARGGSDFAIYASGYFDYGSRQFDIVGWDPRGTGHSTPPSTASTTVRPLLRQPRHHPRRCCRAASDRRSRRGVRHLGASNASTSSSTSARTNRPATWTRSAGTRCRADLLLRVQLRQRARRDVDDLFPTRFAQRCWTARSTPMPICSRR